MFLGKHAVVRRYGAASSSSNQLAKLALGPLRKDSVVSTGSSASKGKLSNWPAPGTSDADLSEQTGRRFQQGRLPAS